MSTSTKSVYTGVDYVRYTANDHSPFERWNGMLQPEYLAEDLAGRRIHNRWILGYYGRLGEHCFLGRNESGCMVQMSSSLAWDRWTELASTGNKCTRMDLQVTWPVDDEPGLYIEEMYKVAALHKSRNGRPPVLEIVDTPSGAKMLTVGSRMSELHGRMYDKGRESKIKEYQGCVRWEIEVKGEQARDLNSYMLENKAESQATRAIVHQFWEQRGMKPFWETYEGMEQKPPSKRTKTDATKLAWLATQVNPSLLALQEKGKLPEAVRALFTGVLTDSQVEDILSLL